MKTRIEIWVDVDIDNQYAIPMLRQQIEDSAWEAVNDYRRDNPGVLKSIMVQANELEEKRVY